MQKHEDKNITLYNILFEYENESYNCYLEYIRSSTTFFFFKSILRKHVL